MSKSIKDSRKQYNDEFECEYQLTLRKKQRKVKSTLYSLYTRED